MIIDDWCRIIWQAAAAPTLVITGVRKISSNFHFEITGLSGAPDYKDLGYTAAKGRQLERNYWNQELVDAGIEKLKGRKDKPHTSVTIPLQGSEKDSRSQGHCMIAMVVTEIPKSSTVDIFYRSTELTQKFLADLIFLSHKLPPVFEAMEIEPSVIRFHFANVYLSAVFAPIFLRYESNPGGFFDYLELKDPKFYRTYGLATRRFFNETHNYTYRSRVKQFEYFKEFVDQEKVAGLKLTLQRLKGRGR